MLRDGRSRLKEFYYRLKYQFSRGLYSYTLEGQEVEFKVGTYAEFRRFQSFMGESDITADLLREIEPEDVFFDVGANVGIYSCFVGKKLDGNRVFAFEPEPKNADRLQENVIINDLNINIFRIALSDRCGETELKLAGEIAGLGQHSLVSESTGQTVSVIQKRGDWLLANQNVPIPTVLKIDVEGAEHRVLKGFSKTLDNEKCRLVYCEVHPEQMSEFGDDVESLDRILSEAGFELNIIKSMGDKFFVKAEKPDGG